MAMRNNNSLEKIVKNVKQKRMLKRAVALMSVAVILITFNSTKFMADTLEHIADCGFNYDHQHGPECYDASGELVCELHVHTDACYQRRPAGDTDAEVYEDEPVAEPIEEVVSEPVDLPVVEAESEQVEAAVEEVEVQLGGDEEPAEIEYEALELESRDDALEPEALPLYYVGEQYPFFLSDVLNACGLEIPLADVVEIGQALDGDSAPQTLSFERIENDYAIYPTEDCEEQELAIVTTTGFAAVRLIEAVVPEWAKAPVQVPEETGEEAVVEAVEEEKAEPVEETAEPEEVTEDEKAEAVEETAEPEEVIEEVKAEAVEETAEPEEVTEDEKAETVEETTEPEEVIEDEKAETVEETAEPEEVTEDEKAETVEETAEPEEVVEVEAVEEIEEKIEPEEATEEVKEEPVEGIEEIEEPAEPEEVVEAEKAELVEEPAEPEEVVEAEKAELVEEITERGEVTEAKEDVEETVEPEEEKTEEVEDVEETKETEEVEETEESEEAPAEPAVADAGIEGDRTLIIDLAQVESYPLSLNAMLAHFQPETVSRTEPAEAPEESAPVEEASEEMAGEAEIVEDLEVESEAVEASVDEVELELGEEPVAASETEVVEVVGKGMLPVLAYDDALLSVEAEGNDYLITPVAPFERTDIIVNDTYTILLLNSRVEVVAPMPAQSFEGATETMVVKVEAGEGAFPEGTTMSLEEIDDEDTLTGIGDAAAVESFVEVQRVHAVDITFRDADGNEIEPLIPISVIMSIRETEQDEDTTVVHVDSEGNPEVVQDTVSAVEEALPTEAPTESVSFVSDAFSVYAVVVTKKLETRVIADGGETYEITVTYTEDAAIPEGARLDVQEITGDEAWEYLNQAEGAVEADRQIALARFFDIRILDGEKNEVQPAVPVMVTAELVNDGETDLTDATPCAVHFAGDEPDLLPASGTDEAVTFRAEGFSVWGVVYTVDFRWDVDGRSFEFSIPGGGFISLSELVEALGIPGGENGGAANGIEQPILLDDGMVGEATRKFIANVENVAFSAPELVSVSRVDADTTVGAIRDGLGLAIEYSAALTENDIARINAAEVAAGDWALISLKAFDTNETLTVTMKTGEVFTIQVADAQISKIVFSEDGQAYEITVTYPAAAQIPDGAELKVREIVKGDVDYDEYYRRAIEKASGSVAASAIEGAAHTGEALPADAETVANEASEQTPGAQEADKTTRYARFFDIEIWANGQKVEPKSDVFVTISLADVPEIITSAPQVVHFGDDGAELMKVNEDRATDSAVTELSFTTGGFSVYAVVVIDAYSGAFTFTGEDYTVRISYTEAAALPIGTLMTVRELEQDSDEFLRRLGETWVELNREYLEVEEMRANYNEGMDYLPDVNPINVDAVRFFDISFTHDGQPIEPKEPVQVEITYDMGLTALSEEPMVGVAHFAEEGIEMIDDVDTTFDEAGGVKSFRYKQASFSDTGTYVGQETHNPEIEPTYEEAPGLKALKSALSRAASEGGSGNRDGDTIDGDDGVVSIPKQPQASKSLTSNEDGTYKLALSVTGAQDTATMANITKSNVLIVMDRSSSMVNAENKTYVKYDGEYVNGTTYYGYHNNSYVELTYTNGKYYRRNNQWPYAAIEYDGDIYLYQTRLDAEQGALNTLINQLMDINRPGETVTGTNNESIRLDDIIEAKVISFASYRSDSTDPYYSNTSNQTHGGYSSIQHTGDFAHTESGWSTNKTTLLSAVNDDSNAKGTNWQEAMQYAKEMADAKKREQPDEKVYVIFLTDGEPTDVYHGTGNAQYSRDWSQKETALKAAQPDAYSIVNPHNVITTDNQTVTTDHELYGIFTYGDVDQQKSFLRRLVNYAYLSNNNASYNNSEDDVEGGTKQYYYDASDTSQLLNAFQNILSTISDSLAFGRVSITDGITTDAATTAVVAGSAQGFRYRVSGSVGDLYTVTTSGTAENPEVEFTIGTTTYSGDQVQKKTGADDKQYYSVTVGGTEYKMALASVGGTNGNKEVVWDLSALGTLMGGYTYTVEFDIWPNQEAYDYVADLNNGVNNMTWDKSLPTYHDYTNTKGYEIGGIAQYPSIVRKPDGKGGYVFSVLTNTEQEVQYSIVETKTENGVTTTTYDGPYTVQLTPPEPMDLKDTRMSVEKVWDDKLDEEQLEELLYDNDKTPKEYKITLLVWQADTLEALNTAIAEGQAKIDAANNNIEAAEDYYYESITVGWDEGENDYVWLKDFTVAPGLMVPLAHAVSMGVTIVEANMVKYNNEDYYILDQGHYYTITEPGIDRHYELNTQIYHPMIIDDVLRQVTIENDVVKPAEGTLTQLKADNTIKGGIDVQKKVYDNDGTEITNTDDTFTVKLTMKYKDGNPYTDFDYRIYYGENNPNYANITDYPRHRTGHVFGTVDAKPGDNEDEDVDVAEPPEGKRRILNNTDGIVTMELYVGDVLRVINIPAGVTYTVEEDQTKLPKLEGAENSLYKYVRIDYKIRTGAGEYEEDTANSSGTYTVKGNSASLATVVNKIPSVPMKIIKISDGDQNKPMDGVWFKLYYDAEETHQVLKDSIGQPFGQTVELPDGSSANGVIVTDEEGKASLGRLIAGDYYLREIKTKDGYLLPELIPIRITKLSNESLHVSYEQKGNTLASTGDGVIPTDDGFAVVINNNTGAKLPATGGPGTAAYTITGVALIALALALLLRRRENA